MKTKNLLNKKAVITSDNENYNPYRDKKLIIVYADNKGNGYDMGMYPQLLCDFVCEDGTDFPFALYEYEFQLVK